MLLLRDLRRAGFLDGLTLQEIADRLGGVNRSTILRTLRDLDALEAEIERVWAAWRKKDA